MSTLHCFRDVNLHASPSSYAFTSPSSRLSPTLVVDRPSGDLSMSDQVPLGAKRVSNIAGILGIIKLRLDKYIIVITKAQPVGRLKGHTVYKIMATEFLHLHERPLHDPDEDIYMAMLKSLLKSGPMYFSYTLDLTNTFQRQAQSDLSLPMWKRADDRFFWNRFISTDLIDFRSGSGVGPGGRQRGSPQLGVDPYILPVMYGMMRITTARVKSTPLTFILVTRRSRHRAGTRYFSRGIDENGNVSNYNETEQIIVLNDANPGLGGYDGAAGAQNGRVGEKYENETQVLSFVQTRGSVPAYWAEVNDLHYTPKLQIRGIDAALTAARKHFDEQIRLYGDNYLVNLVNHKGREERVKEAYEQIIRNLVSSARERKQADAITDEKFHVVEPGQRVQEYDRLHYVYFDFHNETKGLKWYRAQLLLDQLGDALNKQQYFRGVDLPGDLSGRMEIRNLQTSVVRTNCMDCLDRTNLVQSMLARWTLDRMLTDLGILANGQSAFADPSFEYLFRNVWADNADVVSKSYSGTGALKTDFTRTGQRTRAGMLNDLRASITRYVQNNFADGPKQDGFDVFLGAYFPSFSSSSTVVGAGKKGIFIDQRPALIQAVPYLLTTSVVMIFLATVVTPRLSGSAANLLSLRILVVLWLVVGLWCLHFIRGHGTFYVNWPKLNRPPWAIEDYHVALASVQNDRVLRNFLGGSHGRSISGTRLGHMEEGKKRIE